MDTLPYSYTYYVIMLKNLDKQDCFLSFYNGQPWFASSVESMAHFKNMDEINSTIAKIRKDLQYKKGDLYNPTLDYSSLKVLEFSSRAVKEVNINEIVCPDIQKNYLEHIKHKLSKEEFDFLVSCIK